MIEVTRQTEEVPGMHIVVGSGDHLLPAMYACLCVFSMCFFPVGSVL